MLAALAYWVAACLRNDRQVMSDVVHKEQVHWRPHCFRALLLCRSGSVFLHLCPTCQCLQVGASREKLYALKQELDALCMYANSVSYRVPKTVYQKLCETAAGFS